MALDKHLRDKHELIPDANLASKLNLFVCGDCKKLARKNPDGRLISHEKCEGQRSFDVNHAQRTRFARERDAALADNHLNRVGDIIEDAARVRTRTRKWRDNLLSMLTDINVKILAQDFQAASSVALKLMNTPLDKPRKYSRNENEDHQLRSCRKAIRILSTSGRLGKAMDALRSSKLFRITPETEHVIQSLYVERELQLEIPDDVWSNSIYEVQIPESVVREVLLQKDSTTGRGASGWGYGELKDMAGWQGFLQELTQFLNSVINGRFPAHSEFMVQFTKLRGVALQKTSPEEARPIGVREIFANLIATAHSRYLSEEIKKIFGPYDFGYKVSEGTTEPVLEFQARYDDAILNDTPMVLVKFDVKNAYGLTPRSMILDLLKSKAPKFVRHFLTMYAGSATIEFPSMAPFGVNEGLIQGDALGPFYAQLVYSHVCNGVREKFPSVPYASLFDDSFAIVEESNAIAFSQAVMEAFGSYSLTINTKKSVAVPIGMVDADVLQWFNDEQFKVSPGGVVLLGTPVGTDDFKSRFVEEQAEEVTRIIRKIQECDTMGKLNVKWAAPQGLYHLIRDCANQLLKHLLRTVPPALTVPALKTVDGETSNLLARLLECTDQEMTEVTKVRFGLPLSMAGLGVGSYENCAIPAYLGCINKLIPRLKVRLGDRFRPEVFPFVSTSLVDFGEKVGRQIFKSEDILGDELSFEVEVEQEEEKKLVALSRKMQYELHKKTYDSMVDNMQGPEKFFILASSNL